MADVFSAECLSGFCSQCTYQDCGCLHHLEDVEIFCSDEDDDFDEDEEYDFFDCGRMRDGSCTMAGSEMCDWECPFSGGL